MVVAILWLYLPPLDEELYITILEIVQISTPNIWVFFFIKYLFMAKNIICN